MSGVKTTYVSVESARWSQMQQACERLREVRDDLPVLLEGIREQGRRDAELALRPVAARAAAAEQAISSLSQRAQRFEYETNVQIARQAKALLDLRHDTLDELQAQEQRLQDEIAAERAERRDDIEAMGVRIDALADAQERATQTAGQWLADAGIVASLIRGTLPHERFAPGRLPRLERDLAAARQNDADGHGQAALTGAQRAYHDLSDLRFEVECADREWRALRDRADEALLILSGLISTNAHRPAVDEEGEELPDVDLDVDHWSGGALGELRAEIDALLADVRADDPGAGQSASGGVLSADDLRLLIQERAPAIETRLADIVEQAALAMICSQIRVTVADLVVQALAANDFTLTDHTYEGDDDREAFVAQVTNQAGDVVVIDVSPVPESPAACELRLHSYDDIGSQEVRLARAHSLAGSLREEGLEVGTPGAAADVADEAMLDLTALRTRAPQRRRLPATGR